MMVETRPGMERLVCSRCRKRLEDDLDDSVQATKLEIDDKFIFLTPSEAAILEMLLCYKGTVVSYDRLVYNMYESGLRLPHRADKEVKDPLGNIKVYMYKLRKKIEGTSLSIETRPGLGFTISADTSAILYSR